MELKGFSYLTIKKLCSSIYIYLYAYYSLYLRKKRNYYFKAYNLIYNFKNFNFTLTIELLLTLF